MEMPRQQPILVVGATGHVGRQVATQLHDQGLPVRAVTRDPAGAGLPGGVEVAPADLTEPATLEARLDGAAAVFLVWPLLTTEAAPAVVERLAGSARRVVYLSSMGRPDGRGGRTAPIPLHAEMERLIERSGLEWTFLRPGGFATNTIMWAPQVRAGGVVRWPFAAAARSLIHEADIAAVAVHALTGEGHAGARYVLSGPETVTQAEQVRQIGEAIGRATRFEEIPPEVARGQLVDAWGDAAFVDSALATWASFEPEPELVTHTVEQVTGSPARSFRQWARDHAADFR
jgi:uncharacterized protein YbjT (DUF2867 family)